MNPIASQQAALNNSFVALEKRLKIERCNARIAFTKPKKEETYQVTLDALKLSLSYPAFQITAEVPEIYMHQFWNIIKKIGKTDAYDFKLDKKKCRVDTKLFREILQICPRLPNQDFVEIPSEDDFFHLSRNLVTLASVTCYLPFELIKCTSLGGYLLLSLTGTLKFVSKREVCQIYGAAVPDGMINDDIKLSKAYKTYLDYATGKVPPKKARKFSKPDSPKLKIVLASTKEPSHKGKRVQRSAKKASTIPTTGLVIRDTPVKSVSKNKAPAKIGRDKGIEFTKPKTLVFGFHALLEDAQMKKALKKSKHQTHNLQASGSSEGADFESEIPDEKTDNEAESRGDSEDESDDVNDEDDDDDDDNGDNDNSDNNDDGGNDNGGNEDDYEENYSFTLEDYEEEQQNEEYVYSPEKDKSDDEEKMYEEEDDDVAKELYGDLNITQGHRDTDMANAEQGGEDQQNASQESGFVQEEDDGHITLTTVHDKTEGTMQSLYVSSDFTSKLLNLDNTGLDVNEIASLINTSTIPPLPPPVNPSSQLTTTLQQ
ncbi:hypothetical protein Tco_1449739 [Tanacetum coccineum]